MWFCTWLSILIPNAHPDRKKKKAQQKLPQSWKGSTVLFFCWQGSDLLSLSFSHHLQIWHLVHVIMLDKAVGRWDREREKRERERERECSLYPHLPQITIFHYLLICLVQEKKKRERLNECLRQCQVWAQTHFLQWDFPSGGCFLTPQPWVPCVSECTDCQMIKLINFKSTHLQWFCLYASTSHPHQLHGNSCVLWSLSQGLCWGPMCSGSHWEPCGFGETGKSRTRRKKSLRTFLNWLRQPPQRWVCPLEQHGMDCHYHLGVQGKGQNRCEPPWCVSGSGSPHAVKHCAQTSHGSGVPGRKWAGRFGNWWSARARS